MKLSVVIPVYNVEKYLQECVDSVLNQTLKEFELIAVDDGSTDHSGAILDEYQEKDSRITVIHKENGGVSAARNDALAKCTGDYIYIMDSDDYLEPDALQCMYEEAVRTGADVVITDHCKFTVKQEQTVCSFFPEPFVTDDRDIILQLQRMVLHKSYAPYSTEKNNGMGIGAPWTKLIKRELIMQYGLKFDPYVRGVFDDCLFCLGVFEYAGKVAYLKHVTYHFRVLQSSLTHRFRPNQLEVFSRIYERIRQFGTEHGKGGDFQKAYYARVILYLAVSFTTYFFHPEYQGGLRKNRKEFLDTLKSETYSDAIRNVDLSRLENRERKLVLFERMHLGRLMWLLYTVRFKDRK